MTRYFLLGFLFFLGAFSPCFAVAPTKVHEKKEIENIVYETKEVVWSLSTSGLYRSLITHSGLDFSGHSFLLGLGYGRLYDRLLWLGTINLSMGPYVTEEFSKDHFDFSGIGAEALLGFSLDLGPLRGKKSFGFLFGLGYENMYGYNVFQDKWKLYSVKQSALTWNEFRLKNGLFFSKFEASRLNKPEPKEQSTRLEGFLISLTFETPLWHEALIKKETGEESREKLQSFSFELAFRTFISP